MLKRAVFSRKQRQVLALWQRGELRRINVLEGSVRSGKTWIALVVWALWVATMPEEGAYLMAARTLTTLKRNCLEPLEAIVGSRNFSYSMSRKEGKLFGRTVYLESGNDARSGERIRGLTLQGALCDELTLLPREFFVMLLSRLSQPGAKLIGTTNPDNPGHWLMREFLSRKEELDLLDVPFRMEDNPVLEQGYVEELKKEYTGVYYERFVEGRWVAAEGVIYRKFAAEPEQFLMDKPEGREYLKWAADTEFVSIGVDFGGNRSLTTFVATAVRRDFEALEVIADHHIRGAKGEVDSQRVNEEFLAFVKRVKSEWPGVEVRCCFADSEAQYLINGLRRACRGAGLAIQVADCAKHPVKERIRCTEALLSTGRLRVLRSCGLVIDGLQGAMWDPAAAERGQDVRLDDFSSDIDILDAFEYSWESFMRKLLPRYEREAGEKGFLSAKTNEVIF